MEKYKELRDFAERIKAKGIPEQQYIAEGILGLLSEAAVNKDAAERESENGERGEEPSRFCDLENKMQMAFCSEVKPPHQSAEPTASPQGEASGREGLDREGLSGCIVEEANGDRWIVDGWVYEAKNVLEDEYIKCGLMPMRRTFSQEELERGDFKIIGKSEEEPW